MKSIRPHVDRARASFDRFALSPASAAPLAWLRIGLAAVLVVQAIQVAPVAAALYGRLGILQGPLRDVLSRSEVPRVGGDMPVLGAAASLYVAALGALLVGWRTRIAAAAAWMTHLALMRSASHACYGADQLAHSLLFYLIWMPAGSALSLDRRRAERTREHEAPRATPSARLALRVVQIHLCLVYVTSGAEKASGAAWRNGEAIWRALMLPEYRQLDFSWLARHPELAKGAGLSVVLVQLLYPVLVWLRRTRRPWALATVGLHLAIAAFMGLAVFGALMAVANSAAFLVDADPHEPDEPGSAPRSSRSRKPREAKKGASKRSRTTPMIGIDLDAKPLTSLPEA